LAFWQILSTIGLFLTYRTDSTDYLTISGFTSLSGLICLHSVLDKAGSQSVFKRTYNPRIFIHSFIHVMHVDFLWMTSRFHVMEEIGISQVMRKFYAAANAIFHIANMLQDLLSCFYWSHLPYRC